MHHLFWERSTGGARKCCCSEWRVDNLTGSAATVILLWTVWLQYKHCVQPFYVMGSTLTEAWRTQYNIWTIAIFVWLEKVKRLSSCSDAHSCSPDISCFILCLKILLSHQLPLCFQVHSETPSLVFKTWESDKGSFGSCLVTCVWGPGFSYEAARFRLWLDQDCYTRWIISDNFCSLVLNVHFKQFLQISFVPWDLVRWEMVKPAIRFFCFSFSFLRFFLPHFFLSVC